jgi:hypothetical protein
MPAVCVPIYSWPWASRASAILPTGSIPLERANCLTGNLTFQKSLPHAKKYDQAWVEQKSWTAVRQIEAAQDALWKLAIRPSNRKG